MLANEYICVERNREHTNTFKLSPYRYLEQWFGFPFPSPLSLQSVFEKQGEECESLVGLCFCKVKAV